MCWVRWTTRSWVARRREADSARDEDCRADCREEVVEAMVGMARWMKDGLVLGLRTRARVLACRVRVLDRVAARAGNKVGRSEKGGRERRREREVGGRVGAVVRKGGRRRRRSRISGGGVVVVVVIVVRD